MSQIPPPLPPQRPPTVDYHQPRSGGVEIDTGGGQGITGVNLRWKDNVFQLFAGIAGAVIGGICGFLHATLSTRGTDPFAATFLGAVAGLLAGVFAWGIYLAIYHFVRRRQR